MGLLDQFFEPPMERQLKQVYSEFMQCAGMPASEARREAQQALDKAKKAAAAEGTTNFPTGYGDTLLSQESTNENARAMLAKRRAEGVRDDDIRGWWNLHDLERRMMVEMDNVTRMALFIDCLQKGKTPEEAAADVRKAHPMFGDPADVSVTTGDDRPLPHELKNRINIYIQRRMSDPVGYKRDIEASTTFNALVRREIANRRL